MRLAKQSAISSTKNLRRDPKIVADPTSEERKYLEQLSTWLKDETGYQWIQGTRPQTLAFALADSPAGLTAWIIEKFRAWSDCSGDWEFGFHERRASGEHQSLLVHGRLGSSFWPYYARMHRPWPVPDNAKIAVPTGYCEFPCEMLRPPGSLATRIYTDIRHWTVMPRGGLLLQWSSPKH